jgi:peptidoglycan/xylan/chitin deacetylase (PgdA/CDA1 family)
LKTRFRLPTPKSPLRVAQYSHRLAQVLTTLVPGPFFGRIMRSGRGFAPRCIISFDCDFPRDVQALPGLVDLLAEFDCRASFALIGRWVREYPEEHRCLVRAGHEILNHTETHPNLYHPDYDYARENGLSREFFNRISRDGRRNEIALAHRTIAEVLDIEPTGFRTPHFGALHVDDVYGILAELEYDFSSSVPASVAGVLPYRTDEGIWEIPVSPCPRHPLGVFDTWHSIGKCGAAHAAVGQLSGLFGELLRVVCADGGLVNVYFDPWAALESGELRRMLEMLKTESIPVALYGELCRDLDGANEPATAGAGALQDFAQ